MERAIRENQFVVIICTPRYKRRSDAREGGVGYEGDIMTAEVLTSQNNRKFIPVLRSGDWKQTAPSWLAGSEWAELFVENWNHPQRFTTMHRPGIAHLSGATVILDGTTIEEVECYHRDTLQSAITETNRQYRDLLREQEEGRAREEASRQEHRKRVEDASMRIKFD